MDGVKDGLEDRPMSCASLVLEDGAVQRSGPEGSSGVSLAAMSMDKNKSRLL